MCVEMPEQEGVEEEEKAVKLVDQSLLLIIRDVRWQSHRTHTTNHSERKQKNLSFFQREKKNLYANILLISYVCRWI